MVNSPQHTGYGEQAALYQDLVETNDKIFEGWIELEKNKLRFLAGCIQRETHDELEALVFSVPNGRELHALQIDAIHGGNERIEEERQTIAKRIQELKRMKEEREEEIERFVRNRYAGQ